MDDQKRLARCEVLADWKEANYSALPRLSHRPDLSTGHHQREHVNTKNRRAPKGPAIHESEPHGPGFCYQPAESTTQPHITMR